VVRVLLALIIKLAITVLRHRLLVQQMVAVVVRVLSVQTVRQVVALGF
jgi:hypothetical protein